MNDTSAQEIPRGGDVSEGMKIAVVLRDDLETWQKLNVAAFTVSGVASQSGAVGEPYRDADGNDYLPMFKEPVLVFATTAETVQRTLDRRGRGAFPWRFSPRNSSKPSTMSPTGRPLLWHRPMDCASWVWPSGRRGRPPTKSSRD